MYAYGRPARGIPKTALLQNLPAVGVMPNAPGQYDAIFPGSQADNNSAVNVDIFVGSGGAVSLTFLDWVGAESALGIPLNANATWTLYLAGVRGIRARGGAGTTVIMVMTQIILPDDPLSQVRATGLTDVPALGEPGQEYRDIQRQAESFPTPQFPPQAGRM